MLCNAFLKKMRSLFNRIQPAYQKNLYKTSRQVVSSHLNSLIGHSKVFERKIIEMKRNHHFQLDWVNGGVTIKSDGCAVRSHRLIFEWFVRTTLNLVCFSRKLSSARRSSFPRFLASLFTRCKNIMSCFNDNHQLQWHKTHTHIASSMAFLFRAHK